MTTKCHIVSQAYATFPTRKRSMCRLIADHSGLNVTYSEAWRIADQADTAEAFCTIWENDEHWQDCHNLEEDVL